MKGDNFPSILDQYRASAGYAKETFPDRDVRKRITGFGQADFVEEHLSEDEYGEDYTGFPYNFIFIIAAIRRSAELCDEDAPESVTLGMAIVTQVHNNFDMADTRWRVPDERFQELLDLHCRHALFTNAELAEDEVEQVLDVDAPGDAPEVADCESCVLSH